jgi:hypothetical protein
LKIPIKREYEREYREGKKIEDIVDRVKTGVMNKSTGQLEPPTTKVCRTCKIEKPITEFHLNAENKDGRTNDCGDCRNKAYRLKKEKQKSYGTQFFQHDKYYS